MNNLAGHRMAVRFATELTGIGRHPCDRPNGLRLFLALRHGWRTGPPAGRRVSLGSTGIEAEKTAGAPEGCSLARLGIGSQARA
jgi:hypothetical protein